ncbi:MAG: heavy metal translocating P-type ATPase [Paludibacter sp.]|nr:heavy metal translocating P-type ATPase [Paludibacter sp.]
MKTEKFDVTGMTCSSCVAHVEKSVSKLTGIKSVNVNLLTNSMSVSYDEQDLNTQSIENAVVDAGYEAHVREIVSTAQVSSTPKVDYVQLEQAEMKIRWWVSLVFLIPLLYISMGHMIGLPYPHAFHLTENALIVAFTQFLLTLPIVFVNKKYFQVGFKTLFRAAPNMDSLIAIGSSAAIVYGIFAIYRIGYAMGHGDMQTVTQFSQDLYFESGATILTLITLGKYLEAKSKSRTSDAITRLMDLAPKTATVIRDNIELEIPVEQVLVGDVVVVRPGQRVPVDGIVESGNSSLDESALTGESLPVYKEKGDGILSASINKSGYFTMLATKVGNDTTLAHIIQLVEDASSSKAPISKLADKISAVFVPVVIGISFLSIVVWLLLGYPFDFALSIGIAVLVISCPCALGLATPVAIMVGTGKGAEYGILIKSAESLEMAHKIDTVVLDKTGTITEGKPRVTDIFTLKTLSQTELLEIAVALEKPSEHPLSEAIMQAALSRKLTIREVENFQAIPGQGIEATMDGKNYLAGNLKLMTDRKITLNEFAGLSDKLADEGKTPLFISNEVEILGIIAVADVVKSSSKEAIRQFEALGMEVVMLTGDHAKTAAAIQSQLGISSYVAEVLPQDKDKEIAKLQAAGKTVAMVGDGINDAPALMRSNLGIAIGAGTDIAIESADVVLMRSDLLDAVTTLRLSKAVMVNIKQNLFWAFFYNIIGIPLAAGVFYSALGWKLNPMFAAAAMSFSSVTVVLNALRLLRFKPTAATILNNNQEIIQKQESINKNNIMIEKTLQIKGMSCPHCSMRVEKVLNSIEGVEAQVDLESNSAKVKLTHEVSDETLKSAVDAIGYEVVDVA